MYTVQDSQWQETPRQGTQGTSWKLVTTHAGTSEVTIARLFRRRRQWKTRTEVWGQGPIVIGVTRSPKPEGHPRLKKCLHSAYTLVTFALTVMGAWPVLQVVCPFLLFLIVK